MRKLAGLALAGFILFNLQGCVGVFVAGASVGALGMYAVSKDTVQGDTDKPYDSVWNAALMVARIRGTVKKEDAEKGYIELDEEGSQVNIRLIKLTRSTLRLRITARKFKLPNLSLAQDIYTKIMEQVM